MIQGTYTRDLPAELTGESALLREAANGNYLAQFDNLKAFGRHKTDWAFGWHEFPRWAFKVTYRSPEAS